MCSLAAGMFGGPYSLPSRLSPRRLSLIPGWGYFGPALIPVNQILGSVTSNSGAFDVGGGLNIPLPIHRSISTWNRAT